MDLSFTPEELAFRDEVRHFVQHEVPAALRAKVRDGLHLSKAEHEQWHALLHQRGWLASHWPREWGGPGWTPVQRFIFDHECALAYCPRTVPFGVNMLGPVLIKYGTEAQKRHWLPRILNGDDWWCQGYSEPGAGSDLASMIVDRLAPLGCSRMSGEEGRVSIEPEFLLQQREEAANGARIASRLRHQFHRDTVCLIFRIARMRERHESCTIGQDILTGRTNIACNQHDQAGHPGRPVELPQRMLFLDMADLVGKDPDDHVHVAIRQFDQLIGDHKRAIRQGEGIGTDDAAMAEVQVVARASA